MDAFYVNNGNHFTMYCISNHHILFFKYIQLHVNDTSVKLRKILLIYTNDSVSCLSLDQEYFSMFNTGLVIKISHWIPMTLKTNEDNSLHLDQVAHILNIFSCCVLKVP